jgi:hypothetical protein
VRLEAPIERAGSPAGHASLASDETGRDLFIRLLETSSVRFAVDSRLNPTDAQLYVLNDRPIADDIWEWFRAWWDGVHPGALAVHPAAGPPSPHLRRTHGGGLPVVGGAQPRPGEPNLTVQAPRSHWTAAAGRVADRGLAGLVPWAASELAAPYADPPCSSRTRRPPSSSSLSSLRSSSRRPAAPQCGPIRRCRGSGLAPGPSARAIGAVAWDALLARPDRDANPRDSKWHVGGLDPADQV